MALLSALRPDLHHCNKLAQPSTATSQRSFDVTMFFAHANFFPVLCYYMLCYCFLACAKNIVTSYDFWLVALPSTATSQRSFDVTMFFAHAIFFPVLCYYLLCYCFLACANNIVTSYDFWLVAVLGCASILRWCESGVTVTHCLIVSAILGFLEIITDIVSSNNFRPWSAI